jgi:hypothetical protein
MTVKSSFMQAWVKTLGKFTVPCGAPYQLRNDEQMDSWMFTLEMVSWVTYHHVFEGRVGGSARRRNAFWMSGAAPDIYFTQRAKCTSKNQLHHVWPLSLKFNFMQTFNLCFHRTIPH